MVDRTSASTFDAEGSSVTMISGIANVSDGDTIVLPRKCKTIICQASGDNDAIATGAIAADGLTVTFGMVDDAGSGIGTDADVHWFARRDHQ